MSNVSSGAITLKSSFLRGWMLQDEAMAAAFWVLECKGEAAATPFTA
jgi:hypothetical protein